MFSFLYSPTARAMLLLSSLTVRAEGVEDCFENDRVMIDLFGLGTFHEGAAGNFPAKVYRSWIPDGFPPSAGGVPEESLQFSGRPGWGGGVGLTGMLTRYLGLTLDQSAFGRAPGNGQPE